MSDLTIKPGDTVTLGLGTHDMEVQAWVTFPAIGVTHEVDPFCSPSNVFYREINPKAGAKHFELMTLVSVHNPKHIKARVVEVRTEDWGGDMVLIDLGSRKRWFCPFLINCPPLETQPTTAT